MSLVSIFRPEFLTRVIRPEEVLKGLFDCSPKILSEVIQTFHKICFVHHGWNLCWNPDSSERGRGLGPHSDPNTWKVPEGPWLWLPLYVDIYNENPNANKLSWVINYWKVPEGPGHRHQGHQVVPGEPRTMDSGERHTGMKDTLIL